MLVLLRLSALHAFSNYPVRMDVPSLRRSQKRESVWFQGRGSWDIRLCLSSTAQRIRNLFVSTAVEMERSLAAAESLSSSHILFVDATSQKIGCLRDAFPGCPERLFLSTDFSNPPTSLEAVGRRLGTRRSGCGPTRMDLLLTLPTPAPNTKSSGHWYRPGHDADDFMHNHTQRCQARLLDVETLDAGLC